MLISPLSVLVTYYQGLAEDSYMSVWPWTGLRDRHPAILRPSQTQQSDSLSSTQEALLCTRLLNLSANQTTVIIVVLDLKL